MITTVLCITAALVLVHHAHRGHIGEGEMLFVFDRSLAAQRRSDETQLSHVVTKESIKYYACKNLVHCKTSLMISL